MPGIDQQINQTADTFRSNPQQLQQRYAASQELVDLLALQKLKSEKEAAARQIQMQMQNNPATIKQQREQELMQMTKQGMLDRVAPTLQRKAAMQQQAQQQAPQQAQQAQQGVAALAQRMQQPQQPQRMASGGIVRFAEGGKVEGDVEKLDAETLALIRDLQARGYTTEEIAQAVQTNRKEQGKRPVEYGGLVGFISNLDEHLATAGSDLGTALKDTNNALNELGGHAAAGILAPLDYARRGLFGNEYVDKNGQWADAGHKFFTGKSLGAESAQPAPVQTPQAPTQAPVQTPQAPVQTPQAPVQTQPPQQTGLAALASRTKTIPTSDFSGIEAAAKAPLYDMQPLKRADTAKAQREAFEFGDELGGIKTQEQIDTAVEKRRGEAEGQLGLAEHQKDMEELLNQRRQDYEDSRDPKARKRKALSAFFRGFANTSSIGTGFAKASQAMANQVEQSEQAEQKAFSAYQDLVKSSGATERDIKKAALDYAEALGKTMRTENTALKQIISANRNQNVQQEMQVAGDFNDRELAKYKASLDEKLETIKREVDKMGIRSRESLAVFTRDVTNLDKLINIQQKLADAKKEVIMNVMDDYTFKMRLTKAKDNPEEQAAIRAEAAAIADSIVSQSGIQEMYSTLEQLIYLQTGVRPPAKQEKGGTMPTGQEDLPAELQQYYQ